MTNRAYEGHRHRGGEVEEVSDSVAVEEALQININGRPFTITMRTPGADPYLVKGLLYAEGVVRPDGLKHVEEHASSDHGATIIDVTLPPVYVCENLLEKRSIFSSAACGLCGKQEMSDIRFDENVLEPPVPLSANLIPKLSDTLSARQPTFSASGGSHAAAAFTIDGELLCVFEDIGRHNAVDKVVGWLLEEDRLEEADILFVSGRISFEIAIKVHRACIPFLLAVSAPSSLAIDYARRTGISILGFCRDERATVYSNPGQVVPTTPG